MKTSAAGLNLIKTAEGLRLEAYRCPKGVWTIGYGHTRGVQPGQVIGLHDADAFLVKDLEEAERGVARCTAGLTLRQGQFDALVSFVYNFGEAALYRSQLLKKLKAGDEYGSAAEFAKWIHVDGKPYPGLVKRRAAERELFLLGAA